MAIYKYFLCLLGIILAGPILVLIALAFALPITISGIGYLLAGLLAISGLILAPSSHKYSLALTMTGLMAIPLIAGARLALARENQRLSLGMITLPEGNETSWINYVIDEQDAVIFGEAIFHYMGGVLPNEHEKITQALSTAYSEIRVTQGIFPSPFVSTYLDLQQPAFFDTIIVEPEIKHDPEIGIIFLHGFMGNVTAQCWEIAQAVNEIGAVTVCPSTGWRGDWWQPQGETIIRATFSYLRGKGIQEIYLGGFSNGGFGIGRLISQLGNEEGLSGLFFIDGIYDCKSIRETGLPVLIIQGAQDERMPATQARQIAKTTGDLGTYVEIQGDHFLIMKQPDLVQNALATWLEDHAAYK